LNPILLATGLYLSSFFLWLDRGMFSGQQPGWGIILLGLWGIGALGWFLKSQTWRDQALHPRLVQGLLFLCLLLALMDPKIMYSQIAAANPTLLSKGPIQVFPKTTMIYLQATLVLSLGLLAMTALIQSKMHAWQRGIGILLVALAAASHLLVFRMVPFPLIDVFTTLSEASVALLEGRNPYRLTYTDIYQGQGLTPTGFGYLPGIFPWAISGSLLGGDVRMGNFLALAGAALIFLCGNHGQSFPTRCIYACLLFYGGAGLFVAEQAWIDPVLLFLILLAAWCLDRGRELPAGILAGLLCATKQYGIVAFVFLWLLLISRKNFRGSLQFFSVSVGVGVLVQAPFWIWDLPGYWKTVVVGVGQLPFRPDAYTFVSLASSWGIPITGIPWVGAGIFLFLAGKMWSQRNIGLPQCLGAIGLAYFWIFMTNRHAFCNYYQLVFLLLLSCAALASPPALKKI